MEPFQIQVYFCWVFQQQYFLLVKETELVGKVPVPKLQDLGFIFAVQTNLRVFNKYQKKKKKIGEADN